MKKIIICLCILFSFACVSADENTDVKNKNLYVFDETVDVDGNYDGIGFIAGSNVTVSSNIQYGALAGSNLYFKGVINKDLFALGSSIDISGSVYRDAYVAGTTVKVSGTIEGNLYVYASELILSEEAKINGNLKFYGTSFKTNGGFIGGVLSYYEDIEYIGDTKYEENIMASNTEEFNILNYLKSICLNLLKSLFIFFLIAFTFPKLLKKMRSNYDINNVTNVLALCGSGLMYMFIIPFVASMLLISSIGFSAGIIIMILSGIIIYLSTLFFGYLLGNVILKRILKKEHNDYLSGLIGITLITVLSYIPYIGGFVSIIGMFAGFSVIVKMVINKENRSI